jgi:hypothetical protein
MNQRLVLVALTLLTAATAARLAGADTADARDLLRRVLDAAPRETSTARSTLTSSRGWSRDLTMNQKRIGETLAVYIEVTAPHDLKGTRFLMKEKVEGPDEQYIYIPMVKRAIRIAEEARKQQFLGSDFYVSDLVTPDLDAFEYSFVGEEEIGGRKARLVQAVPKDPEEEIYGKTVFAIDAEDLLVLRSELFDKKGHLFKVLTIEKWEKVGGHWTPMEQVMKDVQGETSSKIVVNEIKWGLDLPDGMFDRSYLLQERG